MLLLFRCGEDKFGVAPSAVIRRSEITSGLVCVTPAYIRLQAEALSPADLQSHIPSFISVNTEKENTTVYRRRVYWK